MSIDKEKLINKLKKLSRYVDRDFEYTHIKADELLIDYINDKEIKEAFDNVGKWYS